MTAGLCYKALVQPMSRSALAWLAPVVLAASSCSEPTNGGQSADSDASEAEEMRDSASQCNTPDELREIEIDHEGLARTAAVHMPSGSPDGPLPVMVNFHGNGSNQEQQQIFSGMNAAADQLGFIAIYPLGSGNPPAWNAGVCCGEAVENDVNDVGFAIALVEELARQTCIDERRIYAAGLSNGGFLAHRIACEAADTFSGIASVAGLVGVDECNPGRPIPILQFHGTADTVVPWLGNPALGFPPVLGTMNEWAERNGCSGETDVTFQQGQVTCERYRACQDGAGVELCTIAGGGHTWPGGAVPALFGYTTTDIDANEYSWSFLRDHELP